MNHFVKNLIEQCLGFRCLWCIAVDLHFLFKSAFSNGHFGPFVDLSIIEFEDERNRLKARLNFVLEQHVRLIFDKSNTNLQCRTLWYDPLFHNRKIHFNERPYFWRFNLLQFFKLWPKLIYIFLLFVYFQFFLTCIGNPFIEKLVKIESILDEEIHCARMKWKFHGLKGLSERENVEVKWMSNDPILQWLYLLREGCTSKADRPNCKGMNLPIDCFCFSYLFWIYLWSIYWVNYGWAGKLLSHYSTHFKVKGEEVRLGDGWFDDR